MVALWRLLCIKAENPKQMHHFFPTAFPLLFLITLKDFFFCLQNCNYVENILCSFTASLGGFEEGMVRTNAATTPAPSTIPIKLDELKLK